VQGDRLSTARDGDATVAALPCIRLSTYLDAIVAQIHDPILRYPCGGGDGGLGQAILLERAVGDLDDRERARRTGAFVVSGRARDDGHVRLGKRIRAGDERELHPDGGAVGHRTEQRVRDEAQRPIVRDVRWRHGDDDPLPAAPPGRRARARPRRPGAGTARWSNGSEPPGPLGRDQPCGSKGNRGLWSPQCFGVQYHGRHEVVVDAATDDLVGDPVNVAARLQDAAQDGDVVIGESTRRLVVARAC